MTDTDPNALPIYHAISWSCQTTTWPKPAGAVRVSTTSHHRSWHRVFELDKETKAALRSLGLALLRLAALWAFLHYLFTEPLVVIAFALAFIALLLYQNTGQQSE